MPVDFLNDDQAAAYGGYVGEVEEAELQRYFFLSLIVQFLTNGEATPSCLLPQLGPILMGFIIRPQDGINPAVVALALVLQPRQHVRV